MSPKSLLGVLLLSSVFPAGVSAQSANTNASQAAKTTKEADSGLDWQDVFRPSGQVRLRPEFRRNLAQGVPAAPGPQPEDLSILLRTRLGLRATPTKHFGAFIQIQDSREFGEEATPAAGAPGDDEGLDLHQGYLEISDIADAPWNLRAGRQEITFGSERLVGTANWANVGRSFDALLTSYDTDAFVGTAFASMADKIESTSNDAQYFGGLYLTWKQFPGGVLDGYYFLLYDNNGATGPAAGTGQTHTVHTVGARVKAAFDNGIDVGAESVVQFGTFGSNSLLAFAEHVALGYTFEPTWKPRLGVEYNYATGDDSDSSKYTKFNILFPTPHAKWGVMDMVTWSNMHDASMGVSIKPNQFGLSIDYFIFFVDKPDSATDSFSTFAGTPGVGKLASHEFDIVGTWTPNPYFDLSAGWGHFFPGPYFNDRGMTTSSDFVYVQAQAQFN